MVATYTVDYTMNGQLYFVGYTNVPWSPENFEKIGVTVQKDDASELTPLRRHIGPAQSWSQIRKTMIPCFVEQLMHRCKNRRCRQLIIDAGYCKICQKQRTETISRVEKYYTPRFVQRGWKPPACSLPA